MSLGSLDLITVTGRYVFLDGQVAAAGTVTFEAVNVDLREQSVPTIILGTPITATVSASGTFSQPLPATDDPDVSPTGFVYKVVESIPHPVSGKVRGRTFNIEVPVNSPGGTVDLAALAAATAGTPSAQYTLQATHNALAARVATLEGGGYGVYVAAVGDGAATTIDVTHNLGVEFPAVDLYDTATRVKVDTVGGGIEIQSLGVNDVRLGPFAAAPEVDEFTVRVH